MFHKLFRGQLTNSGVNAPNLTITNTTSQSLVIDFVNAPGDALVLAVSAPAGNSTVTSSLDPSRRPRAQALSRNWRRSS